MGPPSLSRRKREQVACPGGRSEADADAGADGHVARPRRVDVDPVIGAFDGDGVRAAERKERRHAALKAVIALLPAVRLLTIEAGAGEEAGVAVRLGEAVLDDAV